MRNLKPGKLVAGLLFLCLLPVLMASSSFYPPVLKHWASENIRPFMHLYRAHSQGDTSATELLSILARENRYQHWQQLLADQGVADAQFEVANQASSSAERKQLLREAAGSGHPQALYELGMLEQDGLQKIHYLSQAAQSGYLPAQKALYQWLWMQGQYEEAIPWMKDIAETDEHAALHLGKYYWKNSDYQQGMSYLEIAKSLDNPQAIDYLQLIERYWQKDAFAATPGEPGKQCNMRLQFVATGLDSVIQAEAFQQQFEHDPQMQQLPICVNSLYWAEENKLACNSQAINNYRITCRLDKLDGVLQPEQFTHLVVFHSHGKANVTNGVMYLDLADKYSVFIHELAHFVGFIDEYPLNNELADFYCQPNRQYPNIFVVATETEPGSVDLIHWQGYEEDLSVVRARTCNNHSNTAYKLTGKMTFMEFHDSGFIPPLYLAVWKERLQDPVYTKPAALNIAQALEDVGNSPAAQAWWMRFHDWRTQNFQADF